MRVRDLLQCYNKCQCKLLFCRLLFGRRTITISRDLVFFRQLIPLLMVYEYKLLILAYHSFNSLMKKQHATKYCWLLTLLCSARIQTCDLACVEFYARLP